MFINHSSKEVTAKVVFYGPGLSGKTTCLQYIFSVTNPRTRGELISIETEIERTLFFDLLPVNVGLVKGYQTKFQLYTVPGQIFYDSTRKLVLKGADGIVFVADSQVMMKRQNLDSMENLKTNLIAHKLDINEIPMVFQYNKRDLANVFSIEDLNKVLNPRNQPSFGSVATKGKGVIEALRAISSLILGKIKHLLDQPEEDLSGMPFVDFATNKDKKIIDKEKLPYKKIQTDSFKAIGLGGSQNNKEMKSIDGIEDKVDEEILKVETVEEIDDLKDFRLNEEPMELETFAASEELDINDKPGAAPGIKNPHPPQKDAVNARVPNIPEIDELNDEDDELLGKTVVEDDLDVSEFRAMEEIVEKEIKKEKEKETEIKEDEIEIDHEPFKDLRDIPLGLDEEPVDANIQLGEPLEEEIEELEEIGDLVVEGGIKKNEVTREEPDESDETRDAEPFKLEEEENLDINETPFDDLAAVEETANEDETPFRDLEDKNNKIPFMSKGMDLFDQLKDNTRLTVIKEVPVTGPNSHLLIDIKDKDSRLLETVKVNVTPEIKKITLILDVKK